MNEKTGMNQHHIKSESVIELYENMPCIRTTIVLRTPLAEGSELHDAMTGNAPMDFERNAYTLEQLNRQIERDLSETFNSDIEEIYSKLVPARTSADTP